MDSTVMGRPRDAGLDERIVAAARELMAEGGVEALAFAEVAARARTSRPAIYRRYPDRTSLAVAAIASLAVSSVPKRTGDAMVDLTAELVAFRAGITALNGLGIAAAVLSGAADPQVSAAYRSTVVAPRRRRIAAILDEAVESGCIVATPTERRILVTMCTGSWYGFALAGETPPRDWARRTAALVIAAGRARGGLA